jgi:CHASE2 domain-containing sensor protein
MFMSSRMVVAGIMALAQVIACLVAAVLPRDGVVHPLQTVATLIFVFGVPPLAFFLAVRVRSEAKRSSPVPVLLVIFTNILFAGVDASFDGGVSLAVLVAGLAVTSFIAAFVGTFGRSGATRPVDGQTAV